MTGKNPEPLKTVPATRLFVVGDSISIQYGPYLEAALGPSFHYDRKHDDGGAPPALHNLDVPTGANGGDSGMVLAYLRHRRTQAPIEADFLLVNCGLHDIKTDIATGGIQVPIEQYRNNLLGIIEESAAMNLRLIWVRSTPVFDEVHNRADSLFYRYARDLDAYNAAADEIMSAAHVPIIDLHGFSAAYLPDGFCDHVHYSEAVRELQGRFVAGEIARLVNSSNG